MERRRGKGGEYDHQTGNSLRFECYINKEMGLLLLLVLLLVFGFSALMTTIHSNSARILLVLALFILMAQFLALVHAVVVLSSALVQLDENMSTHITPCGRNARSLHFFFRGNHLGYGLRGRDREDYEAPLCCSCCRL